MPELDNQLTQLRDKLNEAVRYIDLAKQCVELDDSRGTFDEEIRPILDLNVSRAKSRLDDTANI